MKSSDSCWWRASAQSMIRLSWGPLREASSITQPTATTTNNTSCFFFLDPAVRPDRSLSPFPLPESFDNSFGGSPFPTSGPSRTSTEDRETVFAWACCTPDKEEVKRERYVAPARCRRRRHCHHHRRREGKSDLAIPLRWPSERVEGETRRYLREGLKIQDRRYSPVRPRVAAEPALSREPWEEFTRGVREHVPAAVRLFPHPLLLSFPLASLLSRPASLPCPHGSFSFSNLPALLQPATTCEGSRGFGSEERNTREEEGRWRTRIVEMSLSSILSRGAISGCTWKWSGTAFRSEINCRVDSNRGVWDRKHRAILNLRVSGGNNQTDKFLVELFTFRSFIAWNKHLFIYAASLLKFYY